MPLLNLKTEKQNKYVKKKYGQKKIEINFLLKISSTAEQLDLIAQSGRAQSKAPSPFPNNLTIFYDLPSKL